MLDYRQRITKVQFERDRSKTKNAVPVYSCHRPMYFGSARIATSSAQFRRSIYLLYMRIVVKIVCVAARNTPGTPLTREIIERGAQALLCVTLPALLIFISL